MTPALFEKQWRFKSEQKRPHVSETWIPIISRTTLITQWKSGKLIFSKIMGNAWKLLLLMKKQSVYLRAQNNFEELIEPATQGSQGFRFMPNSAEPFSQQSAINALLN